MEDSGTPIYDEVLAEYGDVLDHSADEEFQLASQYYEDAREALQTVVREAYLEKVDEETRRGHILVQG